MTKSNLNDTIIKELLSIATRSSVNDEDFAKEIYTSLSHVLTFDSATLNLCEVEPGYHLPELKSFLFQQPQAMAVNYQLTSHTDMFSPVLLSNNFKALVGLDFIDYDELVETPFYQKHCYHFDVQNALAIAGRLPGHIRRYLVLYFFSGTPRFKFPISDPLIVDDLFPALFCMWQYRLGFICRETLSARIELLQLFRGSPRLFQLVQLIVENPLGSSKEYARQMNSSERTIEHQLGLIYEKLKISGYHKNKKIEVYRRFIFLEH